MTFACSQGRYPLTPVGIYPVCSSTLHFCKTTRAVCSIPSPGIAVDGIMEAMEKVAEAGGEVLGKAMEIPGAGKGRKI